jgi:hypothetical protein
LILLQNDQHGHPGLDICACLSIHVLRLFNHEGHEEEKSTNLYLFSPCVLSVLRVEILSRQMQESHIHSGKQ